MRPITTRQQKYLSGLRAQIGLEQYNRAKRELGIFTPGTYSLSAGQAYKLIQRLKLDLENKTVGGAS